MSCTPQERALQAMNGQPRRVPARGSDLAVTIAESDYSRVSSLSVVPVSVTKRITPLASSKTRPVVP